MNRGNTPQHAGTKAVLTFVATAYALSVMLSLVIWLTGGHESEFIGVAYLSMFLPAIAVLVVGSVANDPARLRWDLFPLGHDGPC